MNHLADFSTLKNRYFVLRHGRSEANEKKIVVSYPENGVPLYGLTPEGENQARESVKKALESGLLNSDTIIISSDFKRTNETAHIAKEILGTAAVIFSEKLRERKFGDWELQPSNYQVVWDEDAKNAEHKTRGVESTREVLARVTSLVKDLEKEYEGKTILLVSHGDAIQILQTAFQRVDSGTHRKLPHIDTAEIMRLELSK